MALVSCRGVCPKNTFYVQAKKKEEEKKKKNRLAIIDGDDLTDKERRRTVFASTNFSNEVGEKGRGNRRTSWLKTRAKHSPSFV